MVRIEKFSSELETLTQKLKTAKNVLITSPGLADGDSIGSQLALRRMVNHNFPGAQVHIVNDEELPPRYRYLPDIEHVDTPESFQSKQITVQFDVAIIVDGGLDRAGRVRAWYEKSPFQVFIDHHAISYEHPYHLKIVEAEASATTELIYEISQSKVFKTPVEKNFAQHIYLGLIFDTGFFRHSNTTPEVMELGAKLLRVGFDFTRLGERGLLERTYPSLLLLAGVIGQSKLEANGNIIWSKISQETVRSLKAHDDDKEGVIDQLFLTQGIEVAVLFIEMRDGSTKISFRTHGLIDVAEFARSLTKRGGGHRRAAGANIEQKLDDVIKFVLPKLIQEVLKKTSGK